MKFVPETISNAISRKALIAQKSSPEVLLAAGVVGVVGGTVLACRATLKMDSLVQETKAKLEMAHTLEHPDYSESDRQRDIKLIYFQAGVQTVRLYGPAVIVGAAGLAAMISSNRILSNRNVALTAAYAALDKGFRDYRARVVDKYGEDADRDLRYGTRSEEIVDPEDHRKKKTVTRVADGTPSIYARFFDQTCGPWSKDHEVNMLFLHCQQQWANDCLRSRGHVFLNEVYDMLGMERSKEGAVVGWVRTFDGSKGDNFINFGVFDGRTQVARDFVNGREGAILLDFNVDGVIYDRI